MCVLQDQNGCKWTCSPERVKHKKKVQPLDPEGEGHGPTAQNPVHGTTCAGAAAAAADAAADAADADAGAYSPDHLLDPIEDPAARLPSEINLIRARRRPEREPLPHPRPRRGLHPPWTAARTPNQAMKQEITPRPSRRGRPPWHDVSALLVPKGRRFSPSLRGPRRTAT